MWPASLHPKILRALKENHLEIPLPIQEACLKASLLEDKHILGAARTGSGKTLAYLIPIINRLLNNDHPSTLLKEKICRTFEREADFEMAYDNGFSIHDKLSDESSDGGQSPRDITCPEAIILVPTRELANQVKEEADKITKYTTLKTVCLIGGLNQDKQLRQLRKLVPEIVIATPGRLYEIAQSESSEHLNLQGLSSVRFLVIDEADRMVQRGHFQELIKIIDALKESKKYRDANFSYRIYLFSATLTFLHELPERLKISAVSNKESRSKSSKQTRHFDPSEHSKKKKIQQMLSLLGIEKSETEIIDLTDNSTCGRPNPDQLVECKINCLAKEKDLYIYYFIVTNPNKRILVFCNSKDCLRRLSNVLKFLNVQVLKLHADMDQKKRLTSLEKFRSNSQAVLVATDVAARGLDIKDLDCVVHYQVPRTCESYIHRSGRTARVFNKGISLTLCEPKEVSNYKRLCNNINGGKEIQNYQVDLKLKRLLIERVNLAQECDKIDHRLRECKSSHNWFTKAAKECDIELDEVEFRGHDDQENAKKKRHLSHMVKVLNNLLKRKIKPV